MPEICYYHIQQADFVTALARLLEDMLSQQKRCFIWLENLADAQNISEKLWTFEDDAFIPHGVIGQSAHDANQPVLFSDQRENVNVAQVLILPHQLDWDGPDEFTQICRLFDGRNPDRLVLMRQNWQKDKQAGHKLSYWQQDNSGTWLVKSRANAETEAKA